MRKSFLLMAALVTVVGCNSSAPQSESREPENSSANSTPVDPNAKVEVTRKKEGTGKVVAEDGDLILVLYKGMLKDGTEFDTNRGATGSPFAFRLGAGTVIKGWDQGLKGAKMGDQLTLQIPSALGYGAQGSSPSIPPNADLTFDVEVLHIVKQGEEEVYDSKDIKVGSGAAVKKGDTIEVHYVGKLLNGKVFDESRPRGETFSFKVGASQVIAGWDDGVIGMKKGGVRKLVLPPALAYGEMGSKPVIGPNQVLSFEIELVNIK